MRERRVELTSRTECKQQAMRNCNCMRMASWCVVCVCLDAHWFCFFERERLICMLNANTNTRNTLERAMAMQCSMHARLASPANKTD
jgi:hypothetical protein